MRTPPPPAITPETDPDNIERRFGFAEGKARREAAQQNAGANYQRLVNAAAETLVPIPAGSDPPDGGAPVPDGGAHDTRPAKNRRR